MEAVYQLKPHELNADFLKTIKDIFGDQEIRITIEADETAYLLNDEANRKHLLAGIEAVKQGRISRSLTLEEAEAMAK
jgi:hypothetical protein